MSRRSVPFRPAGWLLLIAIMGACHRPPVDATEREVTVFAAASLREAFTAMAVSFEQRHPDTRVQLSFAGTQELRTRLEHGAPVDVIAAADIEHMSSLQQHRRVKSPVIFARNALILVVAPEAADTVTTFARLPEVKRIVVGAPEVPIGRYTGQLLDKADRAIGAGFRARVEGHIVSREFNARQVLAKVSLGEALAGIVYRTDALSVAEKLAAVPVPADWNVEADYPIAVVTDAAHPVAAQAWVDHVRSPAGRAELVRYGFTVPDGALP